MDFVQRNLINERNNLQVELAKANILIAQLSEAYMGKKPQQAPYGEKPKAEQGKNGKYEPKENPKPKSMSEQAEYISSLENVITAIAEQLGVHPNDLLNELNVGGAIKSGYQAGGVMGAIKGGANAVGHNVKQTLRGGSVVPTAANRVSSTADHVGADLDRAKTAVKNREPDMMRNNDANFDAQKHVDSATKALRGVRKITNSRGMDDAIPTPNTTRNRIR